MTDELLEILLESEDVLRPFGFLDVLPYYAVVSTRLENFLSGKELASKIWIPDGPLILKRGSKLPKLSVEEMASLSSNINFLRLREKHLGEVKERLSEAEAKAWSYFPPRKLADYYYATNGEGKDKPIERIFIDIDRGKGIAAEDARKVAIALWEEVESDENFRKLVGDFKLFAMWTGSSFHLYIFPERQLDHSFYDKYLSYSKTTPSLFNLLNPWVRKVRERTGLPVIGGHEKGHDRIVVDPSQTPSGKLARCPFSLHMKDARTVDGIALPLTREMLEDEDIVQYLQNQTPRSVLEKLDEWVKNLPKPANS